jgi:ASC-1-like (ASCH) protein
MPSLLKSFCHCIKAVRKTVKLRVGQPKTKRAKESAAIGICIKSVLQTKGKTLKRFSCKRSTKRNKNKKPFLTTQPIKK